MRSFLFLNQPFPQCHGSTLAKFSNGSLVAAWFAGTREQHPDTAIWWCHEKDGKWTKPSVLAKVNDEAHWNPVLYQDPDGAMWVYFKTGGFPDRWDTWRSKFSFTTGWGTPKKLGSKMLECGRMTPGPVRGKMVRLSSGTVIAPSSIEKIISRSSPHSVVKWESVIHRSTNGKKWTSFMIPFDRTAYGEFGGIIQPSVWETAPGKVSALFRSTCGLLFRSDSVDDGMTWSGVVPTGIPNPNSAVDVAVKGDVVALAFNPVSGNWAGRSPISVAFSGMSGTEFGSVVHVEQGQGSFSYPAIIETENGFAMTYTWNRVNIAFAYVDVGPRGESSNVNASIRSGPEAYDFIN